MIIALCILWWVVGMFLGWAVAVRIDPVVCWSDLVPIFLMGFMGPLMLIYLAIYWNSPETRKPVKWLSLRS